MQDSKGMTRYRWILFLLAFLIVCVLSDAFFTHFIIYRTVAYDTGRIRHLYEENASEIPIFGTSRARCGYVPDEIGFDTYNYGIDAASLDVINTLLQIELAKPKTTPIIINLEIGSLYDIGDHSAYIPFVIDPRIRELLKHYDAMKWRYYFPGIRYFGYYDWYLKLFINGSRSGTKRVERGYTYELDSVRADPAAFAQMVRARSQMSLGYNPNEEQDRRLLSNIRAHPERLFFLVYSPYHSSCFAHFDDAEKFQAFKMELSALRNVVLIDWGRLDYPDDFFSDTTHLNRAGAVDFSRRLGSRLREVLRERSETGQGSGNAPLKDLILEQKL